MLDIVFETVAHFAMVAESFERCGWHGIDRVGPDQLLDIEDIAVGLVFGTCAGPEQPLSCCTIRLKFFPALAGKQPLVALIGKLGIGNRDRAFELAEASFLVGIVGFCN